MLKEQAMVAEFHRAFGITVGSHPQVPVLKDCLLRLKLIEEETQELRVALRDNNLTEVADALADLLYVVLGTAVTCGIDLEPVFAEVHRSNMTKSGGTFRADGKYMKPPHWDPPALEPILREQSFIGKTARLLHTLPIEHETDWPKRTILPGDCGIIKADWKEFWRIQFGDIETLVEKTSVEVLTGIDSVTFGSVTFEDPDTLPDLED